MKQKLFTLILMLTVGIGTLSASNTSVGGIYYDFDSSNLTASVTFRGGTSSSYSNEYSGNVVIPQTVTYNGATYSVKSIGTSAFSGCSSLTSVTISNSITVIGAYAFDGCKSLASITIPNSVTNIEFNAFSGCSSLESITIGNNVTYIGNNAFSGTSLYNNNSNWNNNVLYIGQYLIEAKDNIQGDYTIIDGTLHIATYAFDGCKSLTSITIPNSVTSIGDWVFENCESLASVTIPNSVTSIGDFAFYGCSSLTSFTIPNSVTSIGKYAFRDCSSLTSFTIPNSVTTIGAYAFYECSSLTSVVIGNSVTSIGEYAFYGCTLLTNWRFLGSNPPTTPYASTFPNINKFCYIPCNTMEQYVVAYGEYMKQFIEEYAFNIVLMSSNNTFGVAKVASRPDCASAIITAIPNEGCAFVKWSDGNTQTTRYVEVTEDINLTAYFAKEGYTIHVYQDCNTTIE